MPKRLRWTHRFPVAMTEEGYRRLKRFAKDSNLEKGEARTFLFENFNSVINEDTFGQRLRMLQNELEDRKRWKEEYLGKSEGKGPATQRGLTSKERTKGRRSLALYGHRLSSLFRTDNFQHRA